MDDRTPVAAETGSFVDGMNGISPADDAGGGSPEPSRRQPKNARTGTEREPRETRCGLGSWRPAALRPCGTVWSFTAAVSMLWVIAGVSVTYYSAVVAQIERRFGLSSALAGFIRNVDNVGYMLVILAVSHLGRYANKPRILAASAVLAAVSVLVFALPHFVYGGGPGPRYGSPPPAAGNGSVWAAAGRRPGRRYEQR